MERETQGHPGRTPEGSALEPLVNLPDMPAKARMVALHLVSRVEETECPFWVGLAVPGKGTPATLLDAPDIPQMLMLAATTGLTEPGPLMLSDTDVTPPRSVYLVPVPKEEFRQQAAWIHTLIASIQSWSPPAIGLYLAPEALAHGVGLELMLAVLREAVPNTGVEAFYLYTGAHGINSLLNASLRLKTELESERLALFVYH